MINTKYLEDVVLRDLLDRLYDFLVRLNTKLGQVRIQIISKLEVPCFNEVVALI